MFKFIKNFCKSIYENPKEGWELIKMLIGAIISGLIGAICFGSQECVKKMLDKIRKD